jgi:hypothetical protein
VIARGEVGDTWTGTYDNAATCSTHICALPKLTSRSIARQMNAGLFLRQSGSRVDRYRPLDVSLVRTGRSARYFIASI